MSEQLKFYKGLESALPTTYEIGALYHCEDTGNTYLAVATNELTLYSTSVGVKKISSNKIGEIFNNYSTNTASGQFSHAEGNGTTASNAASHAEGTVTTASGQFSHAEGRSTTASGYAAHTEGSSTAASGYASHAEGYETTASGQYSHAEGYNTTASGWYSHAEGEGTTASGGYQHVQGKYNIEDTEDKYAQIIGNGTSDAARSNAHTLDWDGNAWFAGAVYVGSTSGTNKDDGSKILATQEYVITKLDNYNAFSKISVGSTTIAADKKADTLTIVAGDNITLTPDATNDKLTIAAKDTTYKAGTGLALSSTTINHSNSITAKTTYNQATASPGSGGTFKITEPKYDAQGHITGVQVATITMPTVPNLSKGTDSTATKSLSFGGTFTAVTDTAVDGHKITDTTTTFTMPSDRLFTTLVPTGTSIPANADLNTVNYLKVGRYYCSKNADAQTLKNCPTNLAFMMEVYSPLSTSIDNETTDTWVYRLRKITVHNSGIQFIQHCKVGGTVGASNWEYNDWKVVPLGSFTLDTTDSNGGSAAVGNVNKPVYINSNGYILPCNFPDVSSHIYMTGAKESSSTGNTSQIVFGTSSDNHVALSSNRNMLVINPNTTNTTNQILLKLDGLSSFPKGIQSNITGNLTGTASKATADASGNNIINTYAKKTDISDMATKTYVNELIGAIENGLY